MNDLPKLHDGPLKGAAQVDPVIDGFKGAAVACGLRKDGREDLALIVADHAVDAAGLFTTNRLFAAPVAVAKNHIQAGRARVILANSGGANAATGQAGLEACLRACQEAARVADCPLTEVLPCSTGVIGQVLDDQKIRAKLPELFASADDQGLARAAGAIMTTDAFRKMARAEAIIDGKKVSVLGLAKGAGMIRPDMATLLCFVLTDAAASPQALGLALGRAVEQSFNRITVDGDMSTNDTILLLASGRAANARLDGDGPGLSALTEALTAVCQDLAQMMVCDGEGAGRMALLHITGAADQSSARKLCFAIGNSPLVKTALASPDPYWGRMLSAAGAEAARENLPFQPEKTRVWIEGILVGDHGARASLEAEEAAGRAMQKPRVSVRIDLGLGQGQYWVMASDLDHNYITLNVSYRS